MRLIFSLLLSLSLSTAVGQGAFRMSIVSTNNYVEPTLSAPTFASGGTFQSGHELYYYKPRGYDQAAAGSLPVMIFWPGYGARDNWSTVLNVGEGLGYYLNSGAWDDLTYGHIVVVAQYTTGDTDPNTGHFDNILTKMTSDGIKYDPDRISITGLSGGAIGVAGIFVGRTSQVAAAVSVSGPSTTSGWTAYDAIQTPGFWQHHGASDATFVRTIGGTLYWGNGGFSAWNDLTPAIRGSYYYNLGHSTSVWNDKVYNPATAPHNLFQFAAKFNKDEESQATQFVDNAEATLDIVDYREALQQTNLLTAGSPKTALLARLATLLTTLNKGGNRYYISPQTSGIGSITSEYNLWTSFTTGAGITNVTDIASASSVIDVTMTQECATGTRDGNISNPNKHRAHGFEYKANISGFVVESAVNNGRVTISSIPTGKHVDIFIYTHNLTAYDDDFSADNTLQTICNSVTKSQYVSYNNYQSISYLNVPETSGNITIDFDALGSRPALVTTIEFLVY